MSTKTTRESAVRSDIMNMSSTPLYFHRRIGTICLHVHMGRCALHVDGGKSNHSNSVYI